MMTHIDFPDALDDEPPSACLVYVALTTESPQTIAELEDTLPLAHSSVVESLHRLVDVGLVTRHPGPTAEFTLSHTHDNE